MSLAYSPDEFARVLYTAAEIRRCVERLGAQISADYRRRLADADKDDNGPLVAVGLMRGAMTFMADLARAITLPLEYDFIWISSYREATSPGAIELIKDLSTPIAGRDVLLVEDIVDTGRTLQVIEGLFRKRGPASLKTCCLLDKRPRRRVDVTLDYVGFVMEEDHFVVGYGLDYAGRYRNLPYIAVLHPKMIR